MEIKKGTHKKCIGKVTIEGHQMGWKASREIVKCLSNLGLDTISEPIYDHSNREQVGEIIAVYETEEL